MYDNYLMMIKCDRQVQFLDKFMLKKTGSSSNTPEKIKQSSASRVNLKCAYHSKQSITNFCKAEDCLLPVCPTCIQVHSDEHKTNKTSPHFQEINKVIADIRNVYEELDRFVQQIRNYLTELQNNRRKNESQIRQKMLQHRQILIRQFQKCLVQMESKIINEIVQVDMEFVTALTETDQELNTIKRAVTKSKQNLANEDILKHIIIYYGKRSDLKYKKQLERINKKAHALSDSSMSVLIKEDQLPSIKQTINNYIQFQVSRQSNNSSVVKKNDK